MKRHTIKLLAFALCLGFATSSYAQYEGGAVPTDADNANKTDGPDEATDDDDLSWSSLGDRALGEGTRAVLAIAETIDEFDDDIWAIMVRQQYSVAIARLVVPWGLLLASLIVYLRLRSKRWLPEGDVVTENEKKVAAFSGFVYGRFFPLLSVGLFGIIALSATSNSLMQLINPYFYALRDIVGMLRSLTG